MLQIDDRVYSKMAEGYKSKTPVEVAIFLKENGVSGDICDLFEGKFGLSYVRVLKFKLGCTFSEPF